MNPRSVLSPACSGVGPGVLVLSALLILALPGPAEGQEWLEMTTARQVDGETELDVRIDYGVGSLTVAPAEAGMLYEARLRYDASRFRPVREYRREDGRGVLRLGLESEGRRLRFGAGPKRAEIRLAGMPPRLDALHSPSARRSEMAVAIGREVPADLEVATGASEVDLELGGIPLTRLEVSTGAGETAVRFQRANPETMREMRFRAGAGTLRAEGLGHAGAEEFRLEGGVGEVTLDFTGEWRRDARAVIRIGMGALRVRVPPDLGVEVRRSTVLGSFTAPGLERVDGRDRTPNWDTASHRLTLDISAALGSIDVEVVR